MNKRMDELPTFLGAGNFFCSYINSDEDDTTSQNINYGKLMGGIVPYGKQVTSRFSTKFVSSYLKKG